MCRTAAPHADPRPVRRRSDFSPLEGCHCSQLYGVPAVRADLTFPRLRYIVHECQVEEGMVSTASMVRLMPLELVNVIPYECIGPLDKTACGFTRERVNAQGIDTWCWYRGPGVRCNPDFCAEQSDGLTVAH